MRLHRKVVVLAAENGCSNTHLTRKYLQKVIKPKLYGGRLMLTWDAFTGQENDDITKYLDQKAYARLDIVGIPGRMTKYLQPLDLTVNKPFKGNYDDEYDKWYNSGPQEFTPGGVRKKPSLKWICDMIARAWDQIATKTVVDGFLQAGISNDSSGDQDDLVKYPK